MKQRSAAKRFESDIAQDLGARRIFLSGAGIEKADVRKRAQYVRSEDGAAARLNALSFRVEAKTTEALNYTMTTVDWYTLVRAAEGCGEIPLFAIRFTKFSGELLLMRRAFAYELGLHPPDDFIRTVEKSYKLGPMAWCHLRMIRPRHPGPPRLPDVLTVAPYGRSIEAVRNHALYAPTPA